MIKRSSGILLPIFSLGGSYSIGTLGKSALEFLDFLASANQTYWQILPIGPTGYGNSPYQCLSSFAGNPYLIDLELLVKEDLLTKDDITPLLCDSKNVDYGNLFKLHPKIMSKAAKNGLKRGEKCFEAFKEASAFWLYDYALFSSLKKYFDNKPWQDWSDEDIKLRRKSAIDNYSEILWQEVQEQEYIQYLFYKQWLALKKEAVTRKIKIIGDMPIYTSLDSADTWAEPEQFELFANGRPIKVAGVPPDAFSSTGQLWGNPIYNWEYMKKDGYSWWKRRIEHGCRLYEVIRFDHFRGFESYWSVPFGNKTAESGRWEVGPGIDFIDKIKDAFPRADFIAEDLGYLTKETAKLLLKSGFPGMKVLEFAFDSREVSNHLPHTYEKNCVCYTGTHDNTPLALWEKEISNEDMNYCNDYLGNDSCENLPLKIIRCGMSSVADLFISQMQDWLSLGGDSRINTPGTLEGNWSWRMPEGSLSDVLSNKIASMTKLYGRKD